MPKAPVNAKSPEPTDLHEFVAFEDPTEQRTWVFDLTFMESNWTCIFGSGCKGVYSEDATELGQGCCSHGAHLLDKADRKNLEKYAARLTEDQWQFKAKAEKKGLTEKNDEGVHVTRTHKGACIFLNRPDFHSGSGCALHVAAVQAGERPLDWKPQVCWQLPLHRSDEVDTHGWITTTIREWKRRDWGEGGEDFHWWCTESKDAFRDQKMVVQTLKDEITEFVGSEVYNMLAAHVAKRQALGGSAAVKFGPTRRKKAS